MPKIYVFAEEGASSSTIGGVEITVKKQSEIQALLTEAVAEWKEQPIVVSGQSGTITIPTDAIRFDIQGTVDHYLTASKTPWYIPWKRTTIVHIPLQVEATEELTVMLRAHPFLHIEETTMSILDNASFLKTNEVVAAEIEVTKDYMDRIAFEIQPIPKSRTSISALVAMLDGVVLSKNETFSFLNRTEEIASTTDIEARRFFASTLYSVILQADTTILERHSQNAIPSYLQPGIEVDVSQRLQKDFAFKNNSNSPMLFHAEIDNDHLLIELYTLKDEQVFTYSVVETKVKPKTIYRLSAKLTGNQQQVVEIGEDGYRVTVYRSSPSNMLEDEEEISRDFYPPVHKIIEVSSEREQVTEPSDNDEKPNEGNSNNSKNADDKSGSEKPNGQNEPHKNNGKNDGNNSQGENNATDPNGNSGKEVIYDKGGNIIYDPNA